MQPMTLTTHEHHIFYHLFEAHFIKKLLTVGNLYWSYAEQPKSDDWLLQRFSI